MSSILSKDGTNIVFDKTGHGPSLILVDGAMNTRNSNTKTVLTKLLGGQFTVCSFDRRGRGESGDTKPYSVDKEIEDIEALIDEEKGEAFLYGMSSGAALVLEAALKLGDKVKKIALYEPPYNDDPAVKQPWATYLEQLQQALNEDRKGDAIELFMKYIGIPDGHIQGMKQAPMWHGFEAVAPSLLYDHKYILGDISVPVDKASKLTMPALIMFGDASFPFMRPTATALSKAAPHGQLQILQGQTHDVKPDALGPALIEFFAS